MDGQLQNNDENRNNNRAPAQFNQWKDDDYIEINKQRYGVGRCWDEQRHGYCGNPHCSYDHRSHHATSNHNNRRPQSNIRMNWGKYKGTLIHEIPQNYILWMNREVDLDAGGLVVAREIKRVWSDVYDNFE